MKQLVDLHCHLLPAVDDGPATLEEALDYARLAAAHGTATIVATPHVEHVEVRELPERVREVAEALKQARIPLRVVCGGELKPASLAELEQAELELIAHGPAGRRWILLEVPFRGIDDDFRHAAQELRRRGFTPLLAHPERAKDLLPDGLDALRHELARGALVQLNIGPLCGRESADRRAAADELLRLGVPAVMATDAHPPSRPYLLADGCAAALARGLREAEAGRLVGDGPARLLEHGVPPLGFARASMG